MEGPKSQERIDEAYVERYAPVFFAKNLGEWRAWLEEHGKIELAKANGYWEEPE